MNSPDLENKNIGKIVHFEFKRDYSDFIMIEIDRFNQPMTKTLLSFLKKRYGDTYWYCIDISGNHKIDSYVIAGPEKTETDENVIHIYSIAIRKEFEGQGWSRKLLAYLIEEAKRDGISKIILEVRENNLRAINFYEKFGFTQTGRERDYYDDNVDALNYEFNLQ